ncbi:MAG: general secretion pathway protein GspK [Burkholderiales bacterium]|nr:general secretion pathway protein GspK [Burkholderiales bacterium]
MSGTSRAICGRSPAPLRTRGIALVLVLWTVTLLTIIASSFAFSSRTETLLSRNQVAMARAQVLADAGVERALYELFKPAGDAARWKPDGRIHVWEFDGAVVRIVLRDESARIDLNQGSEALIKGLLKSTGLNEKEVAGLADAIADWIDPDDFRRPNGAEAREYEAAGRSYKPANAGFESVDELRLVLNVTPELFRKLRGLLTVNSSRTGFNSMSAPPEILYAIPEVNPDAVKQYIAQRERAWAENQPLAPFVPALPYASANSAVYNIVARAETADGSVFIRDTSVQLPPAPRGRVRHLTWLEADQPLSPAPGRDEHGRRD